MPIYEYECQSCGHVFEHFLVGDAARVQGAVECPECRGRELQRLISAFAVDCEATRKMHLNQARKRVDSERRDKEHAEMDEIRNHRE